MRKWLIVSIGVNLILGILFIRNLNNYNEFRRKVMDNIPVKYLTAVTVGDF